MEKCLINEAILSAFQNGGSLQIAQEKLKEKNISVDMETLKRRSREIAKKRV